MASLTFQLLLITILALWVSNALVNAHRPPTFRPPGSAPRSSSKSSDTSTTDDTTEEYPNDSEDDSTTDSDEPGFITCSDNVAQFPSISVTSSECNDFTWGNTYTYPEDFKVKNAHQWYSCSTIGKRTVVSNGIPTHSVSIYPEYGNNYTACAVPFHIELPLEPTYSQTVTEIPPMGIVAIAVNGVPMFGPQEAEGLNAVEPPDDITVQDGQVWYGHASPFNEWHYHNPWAGHSVRPLGTTLIGWALDGFPIFSSIEDTSELDECNGRWVNGNYQYHIRETWQVDEDATYCNGNSSANQWNYIIGCYHGTIDDTLVASALETALDDSCVAIRDDNSAAQGTR